MAEGYIDAGNVPLERGGTPSETKTIKIGRFQIPANQTTIINVQGNSRAVGWIIGGNTACTDMITISATSSGAITYKSFSSPTGLSYTTETNKLKVTNTTSTNMTFNFIDFYGLDLTV